MTGNGSETLLMDQIILGLGIFEALHSSECLQCLAVKTH